jgi:hypothetical protein
MNDGIVGRGGSGRGARVLPMPALHPAPEELIDYVRGGLAGEAKERLQDHLASCRDCAGVVLGLTAAPEPPYRPEDEWQRLEARCAEASRDTLRLRATGALAALFLLAAAGLAGWVYRLRLEVRSAAAPRVNVAVVDLLPEGTGLIRGDAEPLLLTAEVTQVVLILNSPDLRSFPRYRVTVVGPDGAVLWQSAELQRRPEGNFTVALPAARLPAGLVRVTLRGEGDAGASELARYRLAVERRTAPPAVSKPDPVR